MNSGHRTGGWLRRVCIGQPDPEARDRGMGQESPKPSAIAVSKIVDVRKEHGSLPRHRWQHEPPKQDLPLRARIPRCLQGRSQTGLVLTGAAWVVFPSAAIAGGVMSATASEVMFRTKTFPKWFAWVSLVFGVAIFAAAIVDVTRYSRVGDRRRNSDRGTCRDNDPRGEVKRKRVASIVIGVPLAGVAGLVAVRANAGDPQGRSSHPTGHSVELTSLARSDPASRRRSRGASARRRCRRQASWRRDRSRCGPVPPSPLWWPDTGSPPYRDGRWPPGLPPGSGPRRPADPFPRFRWPPRSAHPPECSGGGRCGASRCAGPW